VQASEYVFVRDPVGILYVPQRKLYRKLDFLTLLANQVALDGKKMISVGSAWLGSSLRRECTKLVYDPAQQAGLLSDGGFNLYKRPSVEPQPGDISHWRNLLRHIFRGAPRERTWFEQWVAYPLRHPGTKLFTAVVLWGIQGGGKSLLGEIVGTLYGDNYYELSADDLYSQFKEYMHFRQFVLVNEILSSGTRRDADRLKAMITRERVTINQKYQPQYTLRDCVNWYVTSNHPDAVSVDESERRYFVHRIRERLSGHLASEVAAFKASWEGRSALLYHLIHEIDLTGFDPHAPALETAARREMIDASIGDLDRFVREAFEAASRGKGPIEVTAEQVRQEFESKYKGNRTSIKAVTGALQKFGAVNLGQSRRPSGRSRYWRLVEAEKQPPILEDTEEPSHY